jgi:hypothetical protein
MGGTGFGILNGYTEILAFNTQFYWVYQIMQNSSYYVKELYVKKRKKRRKHHVG